MQYGRQKEILAKIAGKLAINHQETLAQLKQEYAQLERPDFIWHYLLQSFSTMGRASGWHGLIGNQDNYARVTYDALTQLSQEEREVVVYSTCRDAKIRMPSRKADFIVKCYEKIDKMGGLKVANRLLFAANGREGKIRFLKGFPGIGPKYARNIMMDVYHEDFRNSIAIDVRIASISAALGLAFRNYAEHEKFYLEVAKDAGINGWELDRLLFNFKDEFMAELDYAMRLAQVHVDQYVGDSTQIGAG